MVEDFEHLVLSYELFDFDMSYIFEKPMISRFQNSVLMLDPNTRSFVKLNQS